jgi:RNA polymerase sigma-70 factor (ECF subfamily)
MIERDDATIDRRLMAAVQMGSMQAFDELYERHHAAAARCAADVCPEASELPEVIRAAFEAVWLERMGYRALREPVADWLLEIVRRIAAHGSTPIRDAADGDELIVAEHAVRRAEACRVEARRIGAVLDVLPYAQRQVLSLAFYGGLSHQEIGRLLDMPAADVQGRMRLGLQALIEDLDRAPS